ncbi:uncharacterized protein LOC143281183 [Babylonia areolata]|uniref:uncharacterized protein LOC143281183 n=1 Tax=Babylonia areolata TaxID=304850 RepID=UPI003FD0535F
MAGLKNEDSSYNTTFDSSPEGVNITSQPQSSDAQTAPGQTECPHLNKVPLTTVRHGGKGHEASRPLDCCQCGQDVASVLFQQLSLGHRDPQSTTTALQFRDVMVVTQDPRISDVSGLVQGLRDARIPVRVVGEDESDVIKRLADVDEVVVAWTGSVRPKAVRRVIVLLQSDGSQSSLGDFRQVLRRAQHVIWVRYSAGDSGVASDDDVTIDLGEGVLLGAGATPGLVTRGENHYQSPQAVDDLQEQYPFLTREEARMMQSIIDTSPHRFNQKAASRPTATSTTATTTRGGGGVSSGYNPNNCCDNFCLACSYDVGEGGVIWCCACCGELGNWCESCCRGFGEGLNYCIQKVCCDCACCPSGGVDCGDCDCDCGDCGGCDCGDCDCGGCDCVIM